MSELSDEERMWLVIETLAAEHPAMPLEKAMPLMREVYDKVSKRVTSGGMPPWPADPHSMTTSEIHAWAGWALTQSQITDWLPANKIQAIKQLRALSGLGLKQSKDIVEAMPFL